MLRTRDQQQWEAVLGERKAVLLQDPTSWGQGGRTAGGSWKGWGSDALSSFLLPPPQILSSYQHLPLAEANQRGSLGMQSMEVSLGLGGGGRGKAGHSVDLGVCRQGMPSEVSLIFIVLLDPSLPYHGRCSCVQSPRRHSAINSQLPSS